MKLANCHRIGLVLATGIFTLTLAAPAWSQEETDGKAHALLDKVRKSDMERQIATRQIEIDRLKQDEEKVKTDTSSLQQTIDSTSDLVAESSENLNKLATDNKKLEHDLAVNQARINAERLKIEGLRALGGAQGKSLSALNRHLEEVEARTHVRSEEMEMLSDGKMVPGEGREEKAQNDLYRWRKALALAESKTQSEDRIAHDAMKAAATKLASAETGAARAQHLAEIDPLAPPAIAEKTPMKKASKDPEIPATEVPAPTVRRATPVSAPKADAAPAAAAKPTTATNGKSAPTAGTKPVSSFGAAPH